MISLINTTPWYLNWEMWGAIGQGIGALGTLFCFWVAIKQLKAQKEISEEHLTEQRKIVEWQTNQTKKMNEPKLSIHTEINSLHLVITLFNNGNIPILVTKSALVRESIGFGSLRVSDNRQYPIKSGEKRAIEVDIYNLKKDLLYYLIETSLYNFKIQKNITITPSIFTILLRSFAENRFKDLLEKYSKDENVTYLFTLTDSDDNCFSKSITFTVGYSEENK